MTHMYIAVLSSLLVKYPHFVLLNPDHLLSEKSLLVDTIS